MQDHKLFTKKVDPNVREAIWQWLIDHSHTLPTGYLRIYCNLKNQDDFWKRVHYRYTGQFERYNKLEKANEQSFAAMKIQQRKAKEFGDRCQKISEEGNLYYKIILWLYRKTRNKINKYDL